VTAPLRPLGSGGPLNVNLLLRQVILEGLAELARDDFRMRELYQRLDDLYAGSQDVWVEETKAELQRVLNLGQPGAVHVATGYPQTAMALPWVSIIQESGNEDEGQACMGNLLRTASEQIGTPTEDDWESARTIEHRQIGVEWNARVQVGTWTLAPESSLLLHEAVKAAIFLERGRVREAGVLNLSMSEGGMTPEGHELYPRVGYVPICSVSMQWTWRQTKRTKVPTRVRLTLTHGN